MAKEQQRLRPTPISAGQEIIVKFREGGPLEEQKGRLSAEHISFKRFERTLEFFKGAEVRRSFDMKPERLREMQARAKRHLKRPIPSLDLFVRVRVPEEADTEDMIKTLAKDPSVEYACTAGIQAPPPQTPDFTAQQDYQDMAPDGVDAPFAWFMPGGDGNGLQICDCEYGFNTTHEDLPGVTVVSNRDGNLNSWEDHGTAVIGELVANQNTEGVTGISPNATMLFASESGGFRVDCINDAIATLNPGDILVLEMQTGFPYRPAESDPDIHAAVTTAVGFGITVVAAAGNGNANLNTTTNQLGDFIWDPGSADFDDSGAIIVGAGGSTSNADPHSRLGFSDYGDRVNCQGWGEDVVTTGYGSLYDDGDDAEYTDSFGGTSSATPIVAGVVACLQGAAIQALGAPLSPASIRNLLSNPANGTPQADSPAFPAAAFPIGPLPDLRRVLRAAGIQADVFMRDNITDTGAEPYMGGVLCWSPDIISRPGAVADPDTEFGPATWGNPNLSEDIEFGQNNYVYARMQNRGNVPDDIEVSLYWTEAAGFLHPGTWNLLGTLNVNNIQPGDQVVAGPVIWPSAEIPAVGHYCMIGVVNSARDPITIPGAFASVSDYLDFVRNHNNICYRNMNVVDAVPGVSIAPFSFLLRGLPEKTAHFRLEVRHQLPRDVGVEMELAKPLPRFEHIEEIRGDNGIIRRLAPFTRLQIKERKPLIIDDIPLKRNDAVPVKIQLQIPDDTPLGEYLIHADQYLGRNHLGRVNYLIRVGKPVGRTH
jgi:hypothetical protein